MNILGPPSKVISTTNFDKKERNLIVFGDSELRELDYNK